MAKLKFKIFGLMALLILSFSLMNIYSIQAKESNGVKNNYYFNQLITEDSKNIYNALNNILEEDKFKSGTYSIDLVENGYLENREYNQNNLMSDFAAARDAFMFDNAGLFYIDFSKISLRQLQNGANYKIMLGIGREKDYYALGFTKNNINQAINEFVTKINEITTLATKGKTISEKIEIAYEEVIKASSYALEKDAQTENVNYVRTPYGTLVKGESICEGFARSLKIILDELNITSVLVQGYYESEIESQLHMWNYVKLDDNRWYLLDPTMENGVSENGTSRKYFLQNANSKIYENYIENGAISITNNQSFELTYPTLSQVEYNSVSENPFKIIDENNIRYVSYLGKGIEANENDGKYIIYTYDETLKGEWYYYSLFYAYACFGQGNGSTANIADIDSETHFQDIFSASVFAVTNKKPSITFAEAAGGSTNYKYEGNLEEIYDYSTELGNSFGKEAPYAIKKTPSGAPLTEDSTYDVTIKYNESLTKIYETESVTLEASAKGIDKVEFKNVKWDENNPNEISFTFETESSYYKNLSYYFTPTNLVGAESKEKPQPTAFNVVNNVKFACPKVEGSINQVYTNQPALIASSDLSTNGWKDENGNSIMNMPSRLALVASKPTKEDNDKMISEIENLGEEVLESATYELNLELCNTQISYLNGQKIKVLMPFPDGYSSKDEGVTFKAYHFKKDGTAEEIECVITENGIVMFCDSFSPFALVAVKGERKTKDVILNINGNATSETEYLSLDNGDVKEVKLAVKNGYEIDYVTLNGKKLGFEDNKIIIDYNILEEDGNVIDIYIAASEIIEEERKDGFTIVGGLENSNGDNSLHTDEPNNNWIWIIVGILSGAIIIFGFTFIWFKFYRNEPKNKKISKKDK